MICLKSPSPAACFNCTQIQHLESRVRTLEAKLLRSPTASVLPFDDDPVIEMGPPDTSHVNGHPLNDRRGKGRNRGGSRRRNNKRKNKGRRRDEDPRGDIDIEEEGGTDAYDEVCIASRFAMNQEDFRKIYPVLILP